jgi:catechol 2,3-dioxygenase-like lactoylglutathione lyase family enzyme
MAVPARISHMAFNVPPDVFERECDFWETIVGLKRTHSQHGKNAFFTADPLRDHELVLFADEQMRSGKTSMATNVINHVAFDVGTDAEVAEFAKRLRARGFEVAEPSRDRRQILATSPAGIQLEINTPPYTYLRGYPHETD